MRRRWQTVVNETNNSLNYNAGFTYAVHAMLKLNEKVQKQKHKNDTHNDTLTNTCIVSSYFPD